MVDILVAGALVAAGVTVATGRFSVPGARQLRLAPLASSSDRLLAEDTDLPCPWCEAATGEDDRRCPSCHQPFG